jgi:hypothetical protein
MRKSAVMINDDGDSSSSTSQGSCCTNSTNNNNKKLRFGFVRVCEFQVALGDNPFVSHGPPIRLGRRLVVELGLTVDQHQTLRRFRPTRTKKQMMIPHKERVKALEAAGCKPEAIKRAAMEAYDARQRIMDSAKSMGWDEKSERPAEMLRSAFDYILHDILPGYQGQKQELQQQQQQQYQQLQQLQQRQREQQQTRSLSPPRRRLVQAPLLPPRRSSLKQDPLPSPPPAQRPCPPPRESSTEWC